MKKRIWIDIFPNKTQMSKRFCITNHRGSADQARGERPPPACPTAATRDGLCCDAGAREPARTAGEIATWGGHRGKHGERPTRWPSNPLLGTDPDKVKTLTLKYIWTTYYVHCSIYNIQAMETSKYLSINKWIKAMCYIHIMEYYSP